MEDQAPAVEPEARVAVVLFQVLQERNFIHDDQAVALVATLRKRGVHTELVEVSMPPLDAPEETHREALAPLLAAAREGRWSTLIYTRFWSASLFAYLREGMPGVCFVNLGDGESPGFAGTDYALSAAQLDGLEHLVRAAARGERPARESLPQGGPAVDRTQGVALLKTVRLGPAPPPRPTPVYGSPGCAWSRDISSNPRFEGVPLGPGVVAAGCSFCSTGGVPRRPAAEVLASVLEQLDRILLEAPETKRVQLIDQNPMPYLERLVERLSERAKHPVEVLLETRVDWFLGGLPVFERALAKAAAAGHKLVLFLLGIENFSPRELELFNKGVSGDDNERAVHEYRRLRLRYSAAWGHERAAFGFILYNPWTEPADLALNLMAFERTKLSEFRGELARSKLRLYANTALYHKAERDGLLAERFAYEAMDSARRYGYESEVPWRFASPATDAIYGAHDALYRLLGRHHELTLLGEILRYVQRHPESHALPRERLARELLKQLGPTRVRALRHGGAS